MILRSGHRATPNSAPAEAHLSACGRRIVPVLSALSLVAACGGDSVPKPPPTLQRITLTPAAASVVVGGTQQFGAVGWMSDGTAVPVPAAYAATGGTITGGGRYAAGAVTGTYRVVATHGGGMADTAAIVVTPEGAHNYTTTFPATENPVSEGGHWVNGGAVGLDWTNVSTTPGLAIGHQNRVSYSDATAILTGAWGPDQRAWASVYTVARDDPCFQEVELRLRSVVSAHLNRGYEISFRCSQTASAYLIIVRWNGALGDFTYLANLTGAQYGIRSGDVVSASIVGHVITAYRNGVPMAQATDSTFTSGSPGMGFNLESRKARCGATNRDYGFTSFTATDAVTPEARSRPAAP